MLIDKLNIQRFRGISGTLNLDLSSPLTVIYAPNGTGKTSICDAVEWLLCGSVGRLSSVDKNDVQCRFGNDGLETFVEACIPHQNEPFSIRRVLSSSNSKLMWKDRACDYRSADDQELLRRIVSALPPSENTAKAKVAWVRSTRFLESDSLRLLIDSDEDSNATRKLIFSNLFGVSEYQKAETDLNKILNKLPAQSTIAREKAKIEKKIGECEESIKKLVAEQGEPYRDHASNLLGEVAERLGQQLHGNKEQDLREHFKLLEVKHIQKNELLAEKKTALLFIQQNFNSYQSNISKLEGLNKEIKENDASLASISDAHKKQKSEWEEKQSAFKQREDHIHQISKLLNDLKAEKSTWSQLNELYRMPLIGAESHIVRQEKISKFLISSQQKIISLEEGLLSLEAQIELIPIWRKKLEQLSGINIELKALQERKPDNDGQRPLEEQIAEIKSSLESKQAFREKTFGELELLLSSGKRYVEAHIDDSECPLCEQKYDSNHVLQSKINTRFSKLSAQSKEESILVSKHEELTKKLILGNKYLKKLQELGNEKNQLTKDIQSMEESFIAIGGKRADMTQIEKVSSALKGLKEQCQADIKSIKEAIIPYQTADYASKQLEQMLIRMKSLSDLWHKKYDLCPTQPMKVDNLDKIMTELELLLGNKNLESKQQHEHAKTELQEFAKKFAKLEEEQSKKSSDGKALKERSISVTNHLNDIKRKWKILSDNRNIDESSIQKVIATIEVEDRVLNEAKSLMTKIEGYFIKIQESEKKKSEQGFFNQQIQEAKEQLVEWRNQENARFVIEKEVGSIKEKIMRFVSQEITPLSDIINTLYLRAQGNRFINSIEARPSKEGFLEWIAELNENGDSFDKMLSLSQGQRQDLALAIFLARARSLGGTFLLDEPLAHLDDLNRVALLDTLRIIVSEKRNSGDLRLVLTTASNNLLRHLREKFSLVSGANGEPAMRIYQMSGNPKIGLITEDEELVHSPNSLLRDT